MKRALKDLKTGLYLKSMDEWTDKVQEACFFKDIFQALRFCQDHHFSDIAVIAISNDQSEKIIAFKRAQSRAHDHHEMPGESVPASVTTG